MIRLVPSWVWAAVLGVAALSAWLWHLDAVSDAHTEGMALVQGQWAEARAKAENEGRRASEDARAEEQRRIAALVEIANEHSRKAEERSVALAAADRAAVELQQRVAATAARCRRPAGDPAVAASGPPAADAADLLADVQGRIDTAAGQFAALADDRGDAGAACERAYDSLRTP